MKQKQKHKIILSTLLLILTAVLFIYFITYSQKGITGKVLLNVETNYAENESLQGSFRLESKAGELIPADSIVSISVSNSTYDFILSDLVSEEAVQGDYYIEDAGLSGSGSGYGVAGEKEANPEVNFKLKISKKESSGGKKGESETSDTAEETTSESEETSTTGESETSETAEETTGESEETSTTEETAGESETSDTAEETTSESEETSTTEESETSETAEETTGESEETSTTEETAGESETSETAESGGSILTGQVVAELENIVSGKTSKGNSYTYELGEGETAEIISSDKEIKLITEGNLITITTDYSETEKGFGEDYLGDSFEYELVIDISSLNIKAVEGEMITALMYEDSEILSVSTILSVESPVQSEEVQTENETLKNMTSINETVANATILTENISDYALTDEELSVLKAKTGDNSVKITKSEVVNDRLVIRFEIGDYWIEKSYYYGDIDELKNLIDLDRAKWLKILAKQLSEDKTVSEQADDFLNEYTL
ncbi:MAG: hypothetical protein WC533_02640 [Candidatus Pacearchaeota archaeon]